MIHANIRQALLTIQREQINPLMRCNRTLAQYSGTYATLVFPITFIRYSLSYFCANLMIHAISKLSD